MAVSTVEMRLAALEAEVTRMKLQMRSSGVTQPREADDWLDKIYGSFANDPDFDKAMELGRQYRESLRPKPAKKRAKTSVKKRSR
jgi:hypothetical protein